MSVFGTAIDRNSFLFCLKEALKQMINPDSPLPEKLVNQEVLTDAERESVQGENNREKRNDVLLKFVLQKNDAAKRRFLDCLHDTDQRHVRDFINCDGGKQFAVW